MPTTKSSKIIAENFIKDQIEIMKRYGRGPKLSAKAYRSLVSDTQRSFESMKAPSTKEQSAKAMR